MKKKHAVICHSDHHIQKSLLLKKKFLSEIVIFYLKNSALKKYGDDQPIIIDSKFVSNFDSFIFYTLNVDKVTFPAGGFPSVESLTVYVTVYDLILF